METQMDHAEALQRQACERYLLGELSASESERFETHYFSCPECSADLEAGAVLIENARAVFKEEPRSRTAQPGLLSRWKALASAFWPKPMIAATSLASFALAGICLFQSVVLISQFKRDAETGVAAVALTSFQLVGHARGETAVLTVPRTARFFAVSFDIDPQAVYPTYRCDLKDPAGSTRFSVPAPAPLAGQPITVLLPARGLRSGRYQLLLSGVHPSGGSAASISDYIFNLEFK